MTFDQAVELIKQEHTRVERLHGKTNRALRGAEWVALLTRKLGDLANAAASRNPPWVAEELVKIAATAVTALEVGPVVGVSMGTEGIAEIVGVDTPYPRIAAKVTEPPADAVKVADAPTRVYAGRGGVWVTRDE